MALPRIVTRARRLVGSAAHGFGHAALFLLALSLVFLARHTAAAASPAIYLPVVIRAPALSAPTPAANATGQSLNAWLAWRFDDPSVANPRFTILLEAGDSTPEFATADNLVRTSFDPATFELDTTYYWQVIVTGDGGMRQAGPVWSFRTEGLYASPPAGAQVDVPAGEFTMGCDVADPGTGFTCKGWEQPLHKVWLDHYAIDKFEVTNGQYRGCVAAGKCDPPRRNNSHGRDHYFDNPTYDLYPVLYVSRANAIQYCTWTGRRLPTEAEWEKAARGPIDTRPFPWGSEDTDCTRQNRPDDALCGVHGVEDTMRVGMFPRGASPYGAFDMSGNVFEWTYDRFQEEWYRDSPYANPVSPPVDPTSLIVIRGGSYRDDFSYLTTYHRHIAHHGETPGDDWPLYRSDRLGFRCAQSLP
ncbi:MAG: SUMF1/EgtB/PvdO family nonheme iron enzyme [Caldilineaceae bacterium]